MSARQPATNTDTTPSLRSSVAATTAKTTTSKPVRMLAQPWLLQPQGLQRLGGFRHGQPGGQALRLLLNLSQPSLG